MNSRSLLGGDGGERLGLEVLALLLNLAQRHAVLLEETDEVFTGDAPVLAAGDAIAPEPAGVEPLADRPGRDFTDLRDLTGSKDLFHGRHSISGIAESPPAGGRG